MVFVWKYEVLFECIFSHAAKAQYVSESLDVWPILMPICQFPKFTLVCFKIQFEKCLQFEPETTKPRDIIIQGMSIPIRPVSKEYVRKNPGTEN